MRFLLDANLPRSAAAAIRGFGHEAIDVREIGLGEAEDKLVAAYAKVNGLALITRDFDFSDIRNYPPSEYAGIIVLELPDDAFASAVVKVIESFLSQPQSCSRKSRDALQLWNHGAFDSAVIDPAPMMLRVSVIATN